MPLEVSYPPRILNPNRAQGRHWAKINKAKKVYGREVFILAQDAKRRGLIALPETEKIELSLEFFPPWPPRQRDDDNAEASFKAGRDALALALGVDDSRFRVTKRLHVSERSHGKIGRVVIELRPLT